MFYGLDLNDLQTYRERVNAITPDDIQRVAREYLRPDRLSIVLVGDASVFAKQLAGVGFDQFERIPLADLDLGSADLKRRGPPTNRFQPAAFRMPLPQSPAAVGTAGIDQSASVRDVIARAVKAKGGLEKLRSIRTVKVTSTITMPVGTAGPVAIETTSYIEYRVVPGRRADALRPGRPRVQRRRVLGAGRPCRPRGVAGRGRSDAGHDSA